MLKAFFQTDKGRVRPHNEDNGAVIQITATDVFAIVADGMGGHLSGDVASKMAVDFLTGNFNTYIHENSDVADSLRRLLQDSNNEIYSYSKENPDCQGMGTTVVAVKADEERYILAHVGDSRCYHIKESSVEQITEDHTLVNELVKSGQITSEEAEFHPRKNVIMRAIGTDPTVDIDLYTYNWDAGDYLLMCSDGLSNKVSPTQMEEVMSKDGTLEEKAAELIAFANEAGGEDNISLVLLYNEPADKEGVSS
ncbi:Stp1/IreP family PP2C-type Ser/Thr phosphatase [Alkalihalobacillus sp. AL-G]|uniref:Stp1/IreP family PP2C-type Ser/Thr phosphatase n=1 Tax=Alkalihalobacillus sp. AL-G TaxID=2926399 RepID=UPI00272D770E|nr:Stp1/IreP family PP2C-type Ser/Thr phosphatase [Alkalihalobacillus sp. AL-G]WLD95107.1 Stp1/IreP family PP2C-type Ser/Thr phosphatase [Alkalihalobacillus sp. AL-G]